MAEDVRSAVCGDAEGIRAKKAFKDGGMRSMQGIAEETPRRSSPSPAGTRRMWLVLGLPKPEPVEDPHRVEATILDAI